MEEHIKKTLEELKGTANGEALKVYLEEKIAVMQDIQKITDEVDLKAKQNATQILIDLFRFLDLKPKNLNKTKYN